jgi:hypothetical protein
MNQSKKRITHISTLATLALCAISTLGLQAHAEANRVTFPKLDALVHYTTVRRGNVTEHISTTREAIAAIQKGQPVPNGTHFVLADYRDEKIYRYFVMEKGAGWGADFAERQRTGDWQFQWYWPDQKINQQENTTRCMSCHSSQRGREYLFTAERLPEFRGKPIE